MWGVSHPKGDGTTPRCGSWVEWSFAQTKPPFLFSFVLRPSPLAGRWRIPDPAGQACHLGPKCLAASGGRLDSIHIHILREGTLLPGTRVARMGQAWE